MEGISRNCVGNAGAQLGRKGSTFIDYPRDRLISDLFQDQVHRSPDAIAVVDAKMALTYRELDGRANDLAWRLRHLGVRGETRVGIYLERSIDSIVALMAICKAGGVYVPLELSDPPLRTGRTLERAQVRVIIGRRSKSLAKFNGVELVACDGGSSMAEPPPVCATSRNTGSILFTSGSTGEPKGVVTLYQAVTHHCYTFTSRFALTPWDRMLWFSTLSVAGALEQIVPPLISGGSIFVRDHDVWSARRLREEVATHGITILDLPTAYFQQLVQEWRPEMDVPSNLRLLLIGGEHLSASMLRHWMNTPLSQVRLVNSYGLTEATNSTSFEVPRNPDFLAERVPIGQPSVNREAYVLDELGEPVSPGTTGLLYIDSESLADSYLDDPVLTAERFVPNPFSRFPGRRMFNTGDTVSKEANGNLVHRGRLDDQVKICGYRVELAEVEAALLEHPCVRACAVTAAEPSRDEKLLVAHVETEPGGSFDAAALRVFLDAHLPQHMIPCLFIEIDALPLTRSGKIDRRALPPPDFNRPDGRTPYRSPTTELQLQLQAIWTDVLTWPTIGVDDNFFHIGGNSLTALRIVARIEQSVNIVVPVAVLFENPTIRELAELCDALRAAARATQSWSSEVLQEWESL